MLNPFAFADLARKYADTLTAYNEMSGDLLLAYNEIQAVLKKHDPVLQRAQANMPGLNSAIREALALLKN